MHSTYNFDTYVPSPSNRKIIIADRSLIIIADIEDVKIGPSFTLKNVFSVLNFFANLVLIKKLSHDINCKVTFSLSHCVFQD